jgi:hypothetical protein
MLAGRCTVESSLGLGPEQRLKHSVSELGRVRPYWARCEGSPAGVALPSDRRLGSTRVGACPRSLIGPLDLFDGAAQLGRDPLGRIRVQR